MEWLRIVIIFGIVAFLLFIIFVFLSYDDVNVAIIVGLGGLCLSAVIICQFMEIDKKPKQRPCDISSSITVEGDNLLR